ncbi:MAG: LPS export ABC transporter permease LptG [Rhodospirillaceae bacterium]|jgi:lipopolysaccharide export system permease protein|nr:LPS export ABC transporter permease LptG [Rhodospirillaceae bacterium]MBT4588940.1 LPS export ABC transporter permease LptG [Rhodospirillaceae bacterium]MBT4941276.1 LPS export ABC transporter permease LptG [Rhodospirillaceae bacterium]MBT5941708.1 LPS export ABC transporter permease LptG [Rhodospirillaceae bacterium]MBT7267235.1 LPS export ABC transporter permease LptG [Rhodospirillaceae bacterium]
MRLSLTLTLYIGRSFLSSFFAVFVVFLGIIFLMDTVELLRRASSHENVGLGLVFQMGFMKLPFMAQQIFPFAVLFGGMASFWRLTRSSELVVTRAAGVSAWQFLLPVLLVALILGILKISAFNPLASAMLEKYDRLNATHLRGQSNFLAVSKNGLWLRQASGKNQSVIHAPKITIINNEISLAQVTIFVYEGADKFVSRIDAKTGDLEDGFWHLRDAWIKVITDDSRKFVKEHWVETDITLNNIHESFSPPETMSFWDLPDFIDNLERSGFSALRHRLYWHSLLSAPLLLCAMVLIAATFTLRQSRRGSATFVIVGGVLTGFLLFFFSDLIFALGLRESIPVVLAAWTPSGISMLLGLAMVFHLEDG